MPTSYKPIVWRVDTTGILKKGILVPGKSWYLFTFVNTSTYVYVVNIQYLYIYIIYRCMWKTYNLCVIRKDMYNIIRTCVWLTYDLYMKYFICILSLHLKLGSPKICRRHLRQISVFFHPNFSGMSISELHQPKTCSKQMWSKYRAKREHPQTTN